MPRASLKRGLVVLGVGALFASVRCTTAPSLPCTAAATPACPSLDGVTSFCTWTEWGCAREPSCGGYFALRDEGIDARLTYYYSATTGAFVATVQEAPEGGDAVCVAGPAQFAVPAGCDFDTLAECDPLPRDGGVRSLVDAATDGPFNPTSPPGSPSNQPLALPPRIYPPR